MNDALQAAMLFSEIESLPNFRAPTLDEVLAVGAVVNDDLDDSLMPVVTTVTFDQAIDCCLKLEQPRASAVLGRQMKK